MTRHTPSNVEWHRERQFWTDARVKALRQRHGKGENSSQIATALGTTRDAVSSKAHRLGIYFTQEEPPGGTGQSVDSKPADRRWAALAAATGADPETVRRPSLPWCG